MISLGLGLGVNRIPSLANPVNAAINSYKTRVAADGGTFEAESCLRTQLQALQNNGLLSKTTWMLTPNAYKTSKLYSVVGNDVAFARNSAAYRTNSTPVLRSVAANIPRLDYSQGSCPVILAEPQRTNLALQSQAIDAVQWIKQQATVTADATTSPDGTTNADSLNEDTALNVTHNCYQITTIAGGTVSTMSCWVKESTLRFFALSSATTSTEYVTVVIDSKLGTVTQQTANGGATIISTKVTANITAAGGFFVEVTFTTTAANRSTALMLSNTGTPTLGSFGVISYVGSSRGIFLWGVQHEVGYFRTTQATTTTASATRLVDAPTLGNIYTNNYITASGGVWFGEIINNLAYVRDASGSGLFIDTNSGGATNGLAIRNNQTSSARLEIGKYVAGVFTSLHTTTTDSFKFAFRWNGATVDLFVNGVKVVTGSSFITTAMEFFNATSVSVPVYLKQVATLNVNSTDGQLIAQTT